MEEKSPLTTVDETHSPSEVHRLVNRLKEAVYKKPELASSFESVDQASIEKRDMLTEQPQHVAAQKNSDLDSSSQQESLSLKQLVKTLAEKLKAANETIESLRQKPSQSDEKLAAVQLAIEEKEQEISSLQDSLKSALEKARSFEIRVNELERNWSLEKSSLEKSYKQELFDIQKTSNEKELLLKSLEEKIALQQQKLSSDSQTADNKHFDSLHQEIARLRNEMKELESKNSELKSQLSARASSQKSYEQAIIQQRVNGHESVAKMALQMKNLEEEMNSFKCERVALKREIAHLSDRLKNEIETHQHKESERATAHARSETLQEELLNLKMSYETEQAEKIDIERTLAHKEAMLAEALQDKSSYKERVDHLHSELEKKISLHEELAGEHERLVEVLRQKEIEILRLTEENQNLNHKMAEIEEILREKIEKQVSLEESLDSYRHEYEKASQEHFSLVELRTELEVEINSLQEEKSTLESRCMALESEAASLKAACETMKSALMDAEMLYSLSLQAHDQIKKGADILFRAHSAIAKKATENTSPQSSYKHLNPVQTPPPPPQGNSEEEISSYSALHDMQKSHRFTEENFAPYQKSSHESALFNIQETDVNQTYIQSPAFKGPYNLF